MPSSSIILSLAAVLPAVLAAPSYGSYPPPGNYSQPINYSAPPSYQSSVSIPVYDAKSTPCTSSTIKKASSTPVYNDYAYPPKSTPNGYDSYPPVSTPNNYGGYDSYPPKSTPKNDYGSYPVTTSKPSYGDNYYNTPSSKTTITTTYTKTYVDICETGYITKTSTWAVTYCPSTATATPGKPKTPTNWGWDYETKVCYKGCGEGPKTVTVTVPCKNCNYAKPTPPPKIESKPVCYGDNCIYTTTKVYSTKVITITKTPVPDMPKSTPIQSKPASKPVCQGYDCPGPKPPVSTPASKPVVPASSPAPKPPVSSPASKPVVPASSPVVSKPTVPTGPSKNNNTIVYSTGVVPTPSKTGYVPPAQFTGAAAGVQTGGFVAVVAVAAAMFL